MPGPNVVYRGPADRTPTTVNDRKVSGALLPGTFVEDNGTNLVQLTTAVAKRPLVLGIQDYVGQHPDTAYASGDTGVAYEPNPNEVYSCRLAAGTYAANAPLTIGALGRLTAATAGSVVVAFFDGVPGAVTAGARGDVRIANSYTAA
ncbi:MAG: hypothetical protein ACK4IA_16575 [Paracoccus hibiscisoli]|uniref:hypothetical protein n=1 Tax=Paracoccus hibiscisoli TaxID=2023261 RepID=UPI00391A4AEA